MNVLEQQDVSLYPEQITDDLNLSENHSNMLQNSHEWDLEWDCTMFLMRCQRFYLKNISNAY